MEAGGAELVDGVERRCLPLWHGAGVDDGRSALMGSCSIREARIFSFSALLVKLPSQFLCVAVTNGSVRKCVDPQPARGSL